MWGRLSNTCNTSVLVKDGKCRCIFHVPWNKFSQARVVRSPYFQSAWNHSSVYWYNVLMMIWSSGHTAQNVRLSDSEYMSVACQSRVVSMLLYPRSTEGGKGVYWIHPDVCPSVCPSVRPSVGKVSATFRENYWLNSFHPWDLYLWGKSLDPYRFSCSCPHFWPSGGQKLTENRGFRNFSRKLSARFISSLGFILMG